MAMEIAPEWPEWVVHQDHACVWVKAPSAAEAINLAARRLGRRGGWRVGPDADQEVFSGVEYREHARPGDYTRSVIVASQAR